MKSLNDIFKKEDQDPVMDQENELIANASTEAYDAALASLEEVQNVRERQRQEMADRYAALKGGDYGEE